jgi:glycosyltransferase involved in cell wall biosynthesis
MKDSLVSFILPNLHGGGAERVALNLANHWLGLGLNVEVVLMQGTGDLLGATDPRLSLISLNSSRIRESIIPLRSYFLVRRPTVAIASMWPLTSAAVFAWLLAGRPGSLFVQDHTHLSTSCVLELQINPRFLSFIMSTTYRFATGVLAVSDGVKQDLCHLSGLSPSRVQVIYNPVVNRSDTSIPDIPISKAKLFGDDSCKIVLAVGSFKAQKNFALLIRAFSMLPPDLNARLVILGDGPLRSQLEDLIHKLDLSQLVYLPGFTLNIKSWYCLANLFVLSSSWEGFANVIAESLGFGVPVVSTDCKSGPAEILDHGRFGTLVPVNNALSLANAIQESLIKPHDYDSLRRRGQDFSISKIADQYLNFFRQKSILL